MGNADKARSEDWKDKYFKALNELDEQDRLRAEALGRLSRDLRHVLERFRGHDAQFDHEFAGLAETGKLHGPDQQARLHALADRADHIVLVAPTAPAPAAAAPPPAASAATAISAEAGPHVLARLLAALEVPGRAQASLEALRAEVTRALATASHLDLVAEVAARLSALLALPGEERTLAARDTLQTLIDHLSLSERAQARLNAITPQLQQAGDGATVRRIARELADFIAEYVGDLHSELAGLNSFLVVIKARLAEVASFVGDERRDRGLARAARDELTTNMRRSLSEMRSRVDEAASIERLKQDIQGQLAVLDSHLSTFVKSEDARAERRDGEQTGLNRKLAELAEESETLRRKLAEAQSRALRDTLTGLPNRLAYNERVQAELARCRRQHATLSLVVIDIDRFKSINDTWGHQAGDRVLKHVARELLGQVRAQDFFGRFGGEEFVLLLPETAQAGALTLAESLRRHIASCRFKFKDTPVGVTICCGVAELKAGETMEAAFVRADQALYAAKGNGRNRSEVAA